MPTTRVHLALDVAVDALVVVTAVLLALAWAPSSAIEVATDVGRPSESELRGRIDELLVAAPSDGATYDRTQFPHWIEITPGCDTRCTVLDRQRTPDGWLSAYDGFVATAVHDLQIDHVVPLAEAWVSGASQWTLAARQAFANDLASAELLAVSGWSNQAKGAADPSSWRPPDPAWWCRYADAWVSVKLRWGLTADPTEIAALRSMAKRC
jgi:hypothetical protein